MVATRETFPKTRRLARRLIPVLYFGLVVTMAATLANDMFSKNNILPVKQKSSRVPRRPVRCTCESVDEIPSYHTVDVNPSSVICVDRRAPAMLYPLPISNLKDFIIRRIMHPNHGSPNSPPALYYSTEEPVGLLILIKSAAGNVANRNVYRSTWAHTKYLSKFDMPIVHSFIVGTGQYYGSIPEQLVTESQMFGDLIFEDFIETYRNNTFKTFGGYKWALEVGPQFEFLLMIDDDVYLSVPQVVRFLRQPHLFDPSIDIVKGNILPKYGIQIPADDSFYAACNVGGYSSSLPIRDRAPYLRPWYTSWEAYPFEKFPAYPSGRTIFYSRAAVQDLYAASPYVKHLEVDDAYIGIIAAKLGLKLTDLSDFINNTDFHWPGITMDLKRQFISGHVPRNLSKLKQVWHEVQGIPDE